MRLFRAATLFAVAGVGSAVLAGCSVDQLIWGSDGARVIAVTEQLIDEVASDGGSTLVCPGAEVQFGARSDWKELVPNDPETYNPDYWPEQASRNPQWNIDLANLSDSLAAGDQYPGAVFYRESADGLCVTDISWVTLEVP